MPRPSLPPTPQPSTDITGKNSAKAPRLETAFALPPAALGGRGSIASSSDPSEHGSDSSYRPVSPSSPVAHSKSGNPRKRTSASSGQNTVTTDDYALPPPPTRSRKIIQMKPKNTQDLHAPHGQAQCAKGTANTASGSKKKQGGTASAAGRKIARKTAHSLIERRRRSKMNEEFGVLKDMIPACRGQEMHKLAILQASTEYMRYLEQCLSDLKTAHKSRRDSPASAASTLPPPPIRRVLEDEEEEEHCDEEMEDAIPPTQGEPTPLTSRCFFVSASPAMSPSDRSVSSHSTTTSPAMVPHDHMTHFSADPSPAPLPSDPHRYTLASPPMSAQTPTAHFSNPFRPAQHSAAPTPARAAVPFQLSSPALRPLPDREDQEATAALLMLNTDRRSWSGARGMSVKDLLSG